MCIRDRLGFVDGPSVYGYVVGNPLVLVDFNGLQGRGGERGASGGSSGRGTDNPYKHCKEHPDDASKIICRDHQTGKTVVKPKPKDWDDYKSKFVFPSCSATCQKVITAVVTYTATGLAIITYIAVCVGG